MPITLIQILRRIEAEKEKEKEHNTMEKHEMTARECLRAMKRVRDECLHNYTPCKDCRLFHACNCDGTKEGIENAVSTLEEWLAAHPEETLEPLGDNIYYDPKHRIVADELTEIYTFEVTYINKNGGLRGITSEKVLKNLLDADDVKLIRRQHFITKCHEEEV